MNCTNCNFENKDSAKFCIKCGNPIKKPKFVNKKSEPKVTKSLIDAISEQDDSPKEVIIDEVKEINRGQKCLDKVLQKTTVETDISSSQPNENKREESGITESLTDVLLSKKDDMRSDAEEESEWEKIKNVDNIEDLSLFYERARSKKVRKKVKSVIFYIFFTKLYPSFNLKRKYGYYQISTVILSLLPFLCMITYILMGGHFGYKEIQYKWGSSYSLGISDVDVLFAIVPIVLSLISITQYLIIRWKIKFNFRLFSFSICVNTILIFFLSILGSIYTLGLADIDFLYLIPAFFGLSYIVFLAFNWKMLIIPVVFKKYKNNLG